MLNKPRLFMKAGFFIEANKLKADQEISGLDYRAVSSRGALTSRLGFVVSLVSLPDPRAAGGCNA